MEKILLEHIVFVVSPSFNIDIEVRHKISIVILVRWYTQTAPAGQLIFLV